MGMLDPSPCGVLSAGSHRIQMWVPRGRRHSWQGRRPAFRVSDVPEDRAQDRWILGGLFLCVAGRAWLLARPVQCCSWEPIGKSEPLL